jgi:hypothetical protein
MKMEQTECSETSVYKIQTPGNYPEENIQPTENNFNNIQYQKIIKPESKREWKMATFFVGITLICLFLGVRVYNKTKEDLNTTHVVVLFWTH